FEATSQNEGPIAAGQRPGQLSDKQTTRTSHRKPYPNIQTLDRDLQARCRPLQKRMPARIAACSVPQAPAALLRRPPARPRSQALDLARPQAPDPDPRRE